MKRLLILLFVLNVGFANSIHDVEHGSIEYYQILLSKAKTEVDRNFARSSIKYLEEEKIRNRQNAKAMEDLELKISTMTNRMDKEKQESQNVVMQIPQMGVFEMITLLIFLFFGGFILLYRVAQRKIV